MDEHFFLTGGVSANLSIGWLGNPPQAPAHVVRIFTRHGHTVTPLPRHDTVIIRSCALVLLDCSSLSFDVVQEHVAHMSVAQPERRHALVWVEPGSAFEQLIRWPSVKGIFASDCDEAQLLRGAQSIIAGHNWLPRRLLEQCLEKQRGKMPVVHSPIPQSLTDRERQILHHVGEASTNAQIAYDLCISEHTVKTHLYNIFRKIQVRNRTEASNWVRRHLVQESVI
ncbi:MAG TPA: response regulator transcription factor [Moraxellaceae bacterium]|nr:response regulator transcription factor [Moraxellaceae bacterium]